MIRKSLAAHIARWLGLAVICAASCFASAAAQAQKMPAGFVYLRDVDPTIIQDMRYAGSNNFVGRPLRGYDAAECVVKREVGALLKSVQEELALQGLSLKMFDCYRPTRAVADMVAWSRDGRETPAQKRYNPAFSKADLFRLGYIATHSGHSTGAALDLSLVDLKADNSAVFDPARDYGDCTANVNLRAPDGSVDMGTGYDCADVKFAYIGEIHHGGPAPLAREAGSGDGAARICKLFEGVVAFFAAGRRPAGL